MIGDADGGGHRIFLNLDIKSEVVNKKKEKRSQDKTGFRQLRHRHPRPPFIGPARQQKAAASTG
jgi:hypothetical protein